MKNLTVNLALLNAVIYSIVAYIARMNDMDKISVLAVVICMVFTIPAIIKGDL